MSTQSFEGASATAPADGLAETFEAAFSAHRAGRLERAEALYAQVLRLAPRHAEALHLSGVLAHQSGRQARAAERIVRALALAPGEARYHNSLGEVRRAQRRLAEAARAFSRAIELAPAYAEAHNNLGRALAERGRSERAIASFEEALRLDPAFAEAAMNLAGLLRARGRADRAIEVLRATVRSSPDFVPAKVALGIALLEAGRRREAVEALRAATLAHPTMPEVHVALGDALASGGAARESLESYAAALALDAAHLDAWHGMADLQLAIGELDAAAASYQDIVRISPADHAAHCKLADLRLAQGRWEAAEHSAREAIALSPATAEYHSLLGWALREDGRLDESLAAIERALALDPGNARALANRGRTLLARGDIEGASRSLRAAVELAPEDAEIQNHLGKCEIALGRSEAAVACFRCALALRPDFAMACENLARARRFSSADSEEIERIEALVRDASQPEPALAAVHFALGKIRDDCGEQDRAFAHYAQANRLQAKTSTFDPERHREAITRSIETFTPALFEAMREHGHPSEAPVFIVGMLRSGTTLVEQILSAHPQVHGAGELSVFQGVRVSGRANGESELDYVAGLPALDARNARALADAYLERSMRGAGDAVRVTDKMPTNFLHLGLIAILFPHARVIHCRRDPMDTCLSIYFQHLTPVNPYAFDLYHIGRFHHEYERLMAHWRAVLPLRLHEVAYEDLVADQVRESEALVAACDLDWAEECLRFHDNPRAVLTASDWQVRQPIYRSAVARWRRYEPYLGELRRGLAGPSS